MKGQRKILWIAALGITALAALGLEVAAQTGQTAGAQNGVLLDNTFNATEGGWLALGGNGEVRITPEASRLKTGKPGLAFDYKIESGKINAAILPIAAGTLAKMGHLEFWLKTDSATSVAVVLSEKKPGGGNYSAVVWSPKDTWQQIDLTPADFALNQGPNDPPDPDGKLDLDQVDAAGILDLGQLFAALANRPDFPVAVDAHAGPHTFYVDDFQALAESPDAILAPGAANGKSPTVMVEDFHRPFLNWLTLGGADLSLNTSGNPLGEPALKAQYTQTEGKFVVIDRPLGQVSLGGTSRLTFDIASSNDSQLVVGLEKREAGRQEGPRYTTNLHVPGNAKMVHESIPFSDFTADENGPPDSEGKFSPEQIKAISITDVTAAFTNQEQKNTIWIAKLRGEGAAASKAAGTSTMGAMGGMGDMVMGHDDNTHVTETMSHHMHMGPHMQMTDLRPGNPGDEKRADEIVTTLRAAIVKYKDYRVAEAEGFQPYMANLPLHEYHFTNYRNALQARFRFDPALPTSLLYKKTADGYQLTGAMYTAPLRASTDELNARVPLSVARWHLHVNICEPPGGLTDRSNWLKFGPAGSISTEADCAAAGGKWVPHMFGWMVHVYPFEKDPEDVWAH